MSEMAERIGRAVLAELGIEHGSVLPRDVGITALAAMREPTPDMLAGEGVHNVCYTCGGATDQWQHMIDAALNQPSVG